MSTKHLGFLDLLKAIASNLIVLHHLAFYGPMIDHVRPVLPEMTEWLATQARIAVHVFLAIGGFLAAKSLAPLAGSGTASPLPVVARRFLKLVPPFMVATGLAVAASALAARWMAHDSISAAPTLAQLAAHGLLLHGVLGHESLSAGAWYVAIDFQLFALLALLLWLVRGRPEWLAPALVAAGIGVSLLHFNRNPDWDVWAPYFFGSYGLGALAWWASDTKRGPIACALLISAMLLLGGIALEIEFRSRIALALVTALMLVVVRRWNVPIPGQDSRATAFLGRISYGVFLIHFPVCLVVNAAFTRFAPATPEVQAIGILLAWTASIATGAVFYRHVEIPLARLMDARRPLRPATPLRS